MARIQGWLKYFLDKNSCFHSLAFARLFRNYCSISIGRRFFYFTDHKKACTLETLLPNLYSQLKRMTITNTHLKTISGHFYLYLYLSQMRFRWSFWGALRGLNLDWFILLPYLTIFEPTVCVTFTKLRFRWSFWGA